MIYMDNAATTRLRSEVLEDMNQCMLEEYANPAGVYTFARNAKSRVSRARREIAQLIGAKENEIYFTSGGTEADNWAIISTAEGYADKGKHIITSKIEHHAVLNTCKYLEGRGYEITYLSADEKGFISPDDVEAAIRPDTILISIMTANNEFGTVQPVGEIGMAAHRHGVLFHTDAVQAFAHMNIDTGKMNIDMLSVSAHKFGGPKGCGFLYAKEGVRLTPFMHGGSQERAKRAGTSNTAGIVGMAKAAVLAYSELSESSVYIRKIRDYMIEQIEKRIPDAKLNGDRLNRLDNNINFSFEGIEGEAAIIILDRNGICVSSGSACSAGSIDPSHSLLALGLTPQAAKSSLRMTLSRENTKEEADIVISVLEKEVKRLRKLRMEL